MVEGLVKNLTGSSTQLKYQPDGKDGKVYELEFKRPSKRWDMIEILEEKLNVKFPPCDQLHTNEVNVFLRDLCKKVRVTEEKRANALTPF